MDNHNDNLHKNADQKLYEYAKEMRTNATKAEDLLWQCFRNKKLANLKFRRQHPLDKYIADFYCTKKNWLLN